MCTNSSAATLQTISRRHAKVIPSLCLPTPFSLTLLRQNRACLALRSPIFARIAIVDDVQDVLEVHIWYTVEPMHQSLEVWNTADVEAHRVKETLEEDLHLHGAA